MKTLGKSIAIGVTPCKRYKHTMRTRSGHCVQCNSANIAFQERYSNEGIVYVAGSISLQTIKIGVTSDIEQRIKSLNSHQYAGTNDWTKLYYLETCNSGEVEFSTHNALKDYADPKVYKRNGKEVHCIETFSCSAQTAIVKIRALTNKHTEEWTDENKLGDYIFNKKNTANFNAHKKKISEKASTARNLGYPSLATKREISKERCQHKENQDGDFDQEKNNLKYKTTITESKKIKGDSFETQNKNTEGDNFLHYIAKKTLELFIVFILLLVFLGALYESPVGAITRVIFNTATADNDHIDDIESDKEISENEKIYKSTTKMLRGYSKSEFATLLADLSMKEIGTEGVKLDKYTTQVRVISVDNHVIATNIIDIDAYASYSQAKEGLKNNTSKFDASKYRDVVIKSRDKLETNNINYRCSEPNARAMLDFGIVYEDIYLDNKQKFLMKLVVNKNKCLESGVNLI